MLLNGFSTLMSFVYLGIALFALFVFIDAAIRREDAYRAADKQNKQFWLIVLGIAVAVNFIPTGMFFLVIIGLIASIVYLVDVRPALKQVSPKRGRRGGGSSSDGPYGPYNGGR